MALGKSQSERVADLEVRIHGARLCEQRRQWWPDKAQPRKADVVITEIDTTYLKAQQRGRSAEDTCRRIRSRGTLQCGERRYEKRGSTSVRLKNKRWILSTEPLSTWEATGLAADASFSTGLLPGALE